MAKFLLASSVSVSQNCAYWVISHGHGFIWTLDQNMEIINVPINKFFLTMTNKNVSVYNDNSYFIFGVAPGSVSSLLSLTLQCIFLKYTV